MLILAKFVIRPYPAHHMCFNLLHMLYQLISGLKGSTDTMPAVIVTAVLELLLIFEVQRDVLHQDYTYAYRKMWLHVRVVENYGRQAAGKSVGRG